jgi:hypothetical protein
VRAVAVSSAVAAVLAAAAGTAAGASERDAVIRPGVGIGKVRLGMPLARVRLALGPPTAVGRRTKLGFGSEYVEYHWGWSRWRVGVLGRRGGRRVVMVATGLRRERTRSGVGVGSSERTVRRRLGARCGRLSEPQVAQFEGWCYVGNRGAPQTFFRLGGSCALPPRTTPVCPMAKRVFTVYEVVVANPVGLRLSGTWYGG